MSVSFICNIDAKADTDSKIEQNGHKDQFRSHTAEETREWDKWHKRLTQYIYEKCKPWTEALQKTKPILDCNCSCVVTPTGTITKIDLLRPSTSAYFDAVVVAAINSMAGTALVEFPTSSQDGVEKLFHVTTSTPEEGRFILPFEQQRANLPRHFSLEQIHQLEILNQDQLNVLLRASPQQLHNLIEMQPEKLKNIASLSPSEINEMLSGWKN